jgi:hypothetical protein
LPLALIVLFAGAMFAQCFSEFFSQARLAFSSATASVAAESLSLAHLDRDYSRNIFERAARFLFKNPQFAVYAFSILGFVVKNWSTIREWPWIRLVINVILMPFSLLSH